MGRLSIFRVTFGLSISILIFLAVFTANTLAAGNDGAVDPTFMSGNGANGEVRSVVVQSDGKVIISGFFTIYKGTAVNRIARLNADGSLDSSFNIGSGANSEVRTITLQSDGKILIGGNFTSYNGTPRNYIARLNSDGSLDTSFNVGTGANNTLNSYAIQSDGKVIIGGNFTSYNGTPRNYIARLNSDGSLDSSFNIGSGANSYMYSVAMRSDGKILIGGNFTSYNGIPRNYIAQLNSDGSLDSSFNIGSGANSFVQSIAIQSDGRILIGGNFTSYEETARASIARLDADGSLDTSFNVGTGANSYMRRVVIQSDGKILIGGNFTSYNGTPRNRIARLNSDGSLDTSFNVGTGANNIVSNLVIQSDGKVIIGGDFTSYNGTGVNRVARLNTNGSLDTGFNVGTGADNTVRSVAIQSDGKILIVGNFTSYNGTGVNRVARLNTNGSLDASFNVGTGANGTVYSVAAQSDGKVLLSGAFTSYNGTAINRIARLNTDGSLDTGFNPGIGPDNTVYSVAVQSGGRILIGGDFSTYRGTAANRIARLNTNGSLDTSFNVGTGAASGAVLKVAIQSDGKVIIGGFFTSYNGTARASIARLNADGSLDTGFNVGTGANGTVNSVAVQNDGKVIIGGGFTSYNGTARACIVRLNSDGSLDTGFNMGNGVSLSVNSVVVQNDGKILIGGFFTSYNGTARNRIARLNSDGSLDTGFNPGSGADNTVYSVVVQNDGKVIIGGNFTSVDTSIRDFLARLENTIKLASSVSLVSSPNPGQYGQNVTFTATTTPITATGTVTFTFGTGGGSTSITTTIASGLATYMTSTLPVGTSPVTATYSGDSVLQASTSSVYTQTVTKIATSLSVSSSPNPSPFGQTATFTATVSPPETTGTVTFTIGAANVTANLTSGVATYVTNTLASGSYPVSAIYGGSATYSSSVNSNSYTHVVSPPVPGSIQWQSSSYTVGEAGGDALFTATRTGGTDGAISATVVITNGTATNPDYVLPTPANRILSWAAGEGGSKTFVLPIVSDDPYEGDENLTVGLTNPTGGATLGSPATATLTILDDDLPTTNLQLLATPSPSQHGQTISLTATVSVVAPGSGTPTGTVTFFADGSNLATIGLVGLEASYVTNALAVGSHTITATYNGSPQYMPSKAFLNHTVEKASSSVSLTSSPNPSQLGQTATFTATVSPAQATGTVTFTIGAAQVSAPVAGGLATYMTTTLTSGSYLVSATYSGSPTYSSSVSSGQYTHVVSPPVPGSIQWESSSYSVGEGGGSIMLAATRTGGSDGAVSATVVITPGTASSADYTLPANMTLSWAAGESGSKTFVLSIVNDTTYEGNETLTVGLTSLTGGATVGNPATTTLTIVEDNDKPATSVVLTSSANPEQFGQVLTLTASVSLVAPATGAPTSGVVTFSEGTTVLGTAQVDANGVAILTLANLSVGNHTLTAQYGGTASYLASPPSNPLVQVIKAAKIRP